MSITEADVLSFIENFRSAYEAGDPWLFELLDHNATFFSAISPTRMSVEEFRREYEWYLTGGATRSSRFLSPEVRVLGDVAVYTAHNQIFTDQKLNNMRVTFVLKRDDNERLLATHIHYSPGIL